MKFTQEEKQALVKRYQDGKTVVQICSENQIPRSTFYRWIHIYQQTVTESGLVVTPREFFLLQQKVEKLQNIIRVLKTVNCTASAPLHDKLNALESLYGQFSVHTMCDALDVSRGTFYNHIFRSKHGETLAAKRREEIKVRIQNIYDQSEQIFGYRKITATLRSQGVVVSEKLVSQLMRELEISSVSLTAKKSHRKWEKGVNRNFLQQQFCVERPNQVWVSDITTFKFRSKSYYICVIIDLFSRRVLSYRISCKSSTQLLTKTFKEAYTERKPSRNLMFHSDRGAQYMSYSFVRLLESLNIKQSFSGKSNPYDNAVAESFFSTLKKEELYRRHYTSEADLMRGIQRYMVFYSTERPHSTLNYLTPEKREQEFWKQKRESSDE